MTYQTATPIDVSLRIDQLRLTNYRCFPDLAISFDPSLTVLVANNGQGKTAVLDAIATALGPYVSAFDDGKDRAFKPGDIRLVRAGDGNRMEVVDGGVALEAFGVVNRSTVSWGREKASPKSTTTRKDAKVLTEAGKKFQSKVRQETEARATNTCLPLVAYYGTGRLWNVRRLPYKKLSHTSRMVGYTRCLDSGSDFRLMTDWFRYWSINSLSLRLKAQQEVVSVQENEFDSALEAVRTAINTCLKPSGWGDMNFSLQRDEIVARHPESGELPIAMLSDGIRSMLTLVADIAFRTVKLNPNLGPRAAIETDGIVLIDEVDMHLHPAWQQTVLASLKEAFPLVQFIVTTHSPQVATTVPSDCIRILTPEGVKAAPPGTEGAEAGRALNRVFGVDSRPQDNEATQELLAYLGLVDNGQWDTDQARLLRAKLDKRYQGEEPALLEADLQIENDKWERGE